MEGALKYDREIGIDDQTSVAKLLRWVPQGATVLEVGPATGVMTRLMKEHRACLIDCLEIDPAAAQKAEPFCRRMVIGNVEAVDLNSHFEIHSYDIIIFADVLEHLVDPWQTLRRVAPYLKPGGLLLASIPNVSHAGLVVELMQGRFRYRRDGLLDETHLRFFTRETVTSLFQSTGFDCVEWDRTVRAPEHSEFAASFAETPKAVKDILRARADSDTYQFLVRVTPGEGKGWDSPITESSMRSSESLQLFVDVGEGFSEQLAQTKLWSVAAGTFQEQLTISWPNIQSIRGFRMDPGESFGVLKALSLRVVADGDEWISWTPADGPLGEICGITNADEIYLNGESHIFATTTDPQFLYYGNRSVSAREVTLHWDWAVDKKVSVGTQVSSLARTEISLRKELRELTDHYAVSIRTGEELRNELRSVDQIRKDLEREVEDLRQRQHQLSADYQTLQHQAAEIPQLRAAMNFHLQTLNGIYTSRSWRLTEYLRTLMCAGRARLTGIRSGLRELLRQTAWGVRFLKTRGTLTAAEEYEYWRTLHEPSPRGLAQQATQAAAFLYRPLISVVVPVFNAPVPWLREAIESVRSQSYPEWQLCLADDCSTHPGVVALLREYAREDSRIKVVFRSENGHISEATNSALELAQGEYVAFLDQDDRLAPHALFEMVRYLNTDRAADLLYSDEDKIDESGRRSEPTCKPEWSPGYFESFMYIGHLALYRRAFIDRVGRFRTGVEGSQDYDLALRIANAGAKVVHVPGILYHWRAHGESVAGNHDSKPYAFVAAVQALSDALRQRGEQQPRVENTRCRGIYRMRRSIPEQARIRSLVFGQSESPSSLVSELKDSGVEVQELDTGRALFHPSLVEALRRDRLSIQDSTVVLCHRDVALPAQSLRDTLIEPLQDSSVVACGPKILSEQGTVVSAGYLVFPPRVVRAFYGEPADAIGYGARLVTTRNVSALPLLCLAVSGADLLDALPDQEFDSDLAFELALCFALQKKGLLVWTPHLEVTVPAALDAGRASVLSSRDLDQLNVLFGLRQFHDPYYPQRLDTVRGNFQLDLG